MPWILFFHDLRAALYNVETRKFKPFRAIGPNGTLAYQIGSRWLEYSIESAAPCGDGIHHGCGPGTYSFYNLVTHRFRSSARTSSTTIVDLNIPSLIRRVCTPLHVPPGGTLDLLQPFAIASGLAGTYLERCGTRLHLELSANALSVAAGIFASQNLLLSDPISLYGTTAPQVTGVLLPGLRKVTVALPNSTAVVGLDDYRLYVENPAGTVWSATIPRSQ